MNPLCRTVTGSVRTPPHQGSIKQSHYPLKQAITGKMDGDAATPSLNIADVVAELTDERTDFIESKQQDGKQVDIYNITHLPAFLGRGPVKKGDTFRLWVDHQTQLPVRLSIKLNQTVNEKANIVEMEMAKFEWNAKLDPTSFDMNIPAGFEIKDAADMPVQ